jgi:hypothetical protein
MARRARGDARDRIITLAQCGKLTPEQAEAAAKARGLPPLAHDPEWPAFDPMRDSRWPIVVAIAWIAWRDVELTRQQSPSFRRKRANWFFREWNAPTKRGTAFRRRAGWFLETLPEQTAARLGMFETFLQSSRELPNTTQMTVEAAEQQLWQALADGHLTAEALDETGKPVDVPAREWAYLKLFEEGNQDVLKYDPLERRQPFTRVHLKRRDLMRLWPRLAPYATADEYSTWPVEDSMLKPVSDPGTSGYVPLCAAIQWIMTDGGAHSAMMTPTAWEESVRKLWPDVCTEQIELIGLPAEKNAPEKIAGHAVALMKVLAPLHTAIQEVYGKRSIIQCQPFSNAEQWETDFNDKLYELGRAEAAWSHLQVRKSDILARWPRAPKNLKAERNCERWLAEQMRRSPSKRPRSRSAMWTDARSLFPGLGKRQFDRAWQRAVRETGALEWSRAGRPKTLR